VRWRDRAGTYRYDVGDGEHVEIVIAERVYRVRRTELRSGVKGRRLPEDARAYLDIAGVRGTAVSRIG